MKEQQNDVTISMTSKILQLSSNKQSVEKQNLELKNILNELVGFQANEKRCPADHLLRYIQYPKHQIITLICDKCNKKCRKISNVGWRCEHCDYDTCRQCQGYKKNICPYMHRFKMQQLPQQYKIKKFCEICSVNIVGKYYACDCNFDICRKCKEK